VTFLELSAAIRAYTENEETSFVANIPVFVRNAEQRIYNSVQLPALRKTVTLQTLGGGETLTMPADFLNVYSLAVNDGTDLNYLLNKDVSFIHSAYPANLTTGFPAYYAIYDTNKVLFGPTPDAGYDVVLNYAAYPESIVTAGTTWLGDKFESVLLYGSLIEAYTFMKGEDDIIKLYLARYGEAMSLLKQLGDGKLRQDTYRSGQFRMPVQ
jgi:hypothetical protein